MCQMDMLKTQQETQDCEPSPYRWSTRLGLPTMASKKKYLP